MKKITVNLKEHKYDIIIKRGLLKHAGELIKDLEIGQKTCVITNALIDKNYGNALRDSLNKEKIGFFFRLIEDSEKAKSAHLCLKVIKEILKFEHRKGVFITAFGGGVVGDVAGFIASIYKRGIPYIQIPTTLLAQIDSSIGGKTGVDLKEAKNLIGSFYQPHLVLIDVSLLKSLSLRQMRSGLAEAIKYGIIKDSSILDYIDDYYPDILKGNEEIMEPLVYRCAKIKAEIVEMDEKEKYMIRTILNFGHTIGHALEAASDYRMYTHGEAIAIGMLVALMIGVKLGVNSFALYERIKNLLRKIGLPVHIKNKIRINDIIKAYYYDKKFKDKENRFVLVKGLEKPFVKENIPLKLIQQTINIHY